MVSYKPQAAPYLLQKQKKNLSYYITKIILLLTNTYSSYKMKHINKTHNYIKYIKKSKEDKQKLRNLI